MDYIKDFYSNNCYEEHRFESLHNRVEYITNMHYITSYLEPGFKILDIDAGPGNYTLPLIDQGYDVTAVDYVEKHVEILRSCKPEVNARLGDARDLHDFSDNTFDVTLLMGPMYHLFTRQEQEQALIEATRVTKTNGLIFVAYCMQDPTIINFLFKGHNLNEYKKYIRASDFSLQCHPDQPFCLMRVDDVFSLVQSVPNIQRIKLIASDGFSKYFKSEFDVFTEEEFSEYMRYHFAVCERQELLGASYHTLDILRRLQ